MQNYAPRIEERLSITSLLGTPEIQRAFQFIDGISSELDDELVRICEIPAPPFKEEQRAREIARRFKEIGLALVRFDQEGNVIEARTSDAGIRALLAKDRTKAAAVNKTSVNTVLNKELVELK